MSRKPCIKELRKGFRGWHQRGYLPHLDAPNVTQMVTFMLADCFPVSRRGEWEAILKERDISAKRRKLEEWLDRGHGECWLRRSDAAQIVEQVFLEADGPTTECKRGSSCQITFTSSWTCGTCRSRGS